MSQERLELVTSNPNKAKVAGLSGSFPLFDEGKIKKEFLGNLSENPWQYPLFISQGKIRAHREGHIKKYGEGEEVFITSDSVVCIGEEDSFLIVNRDDPPEVYERGNCLIKKGCPVFFIGSASFARNKSGSPVYSIISYFKIKDNTALSLPIEIPNLVNRKYECGIVTPEANFISIKENNFEKSRPYISGLLPNLINLAGEYSQLFQLEEELRKQIASYPFNTTIFYELVNQGYNYNWIVENWREIFERNGGNCSFHSLFFCHVVSTLGFQPEIIIFPSESPNHDSGHSAVKVGNFLFDPGLSIPFPLVFQPDLCQPVMTKSQKSVFVSSDGLVISKNGRKTVFPFRGSVTPEEFEKNLPQILSELHFRREFAKCDIHDEDGSILSRKIKDF